MDSGGEGKHVDMVHGGRVYEYAERVGRPVDRIMDFSANINPLGPPVSVMRAIERGLGDIRHYPDSRHDGIKRVLQSRLGVNGDQILCTNGAEEALELLFRTIRPPRTVVLTPAFMEYATIASRYGSQVCAIPLSIDVDVRLPMDKLDGVLRAGDVLVLNNPHNPTGASWPRHQWRKYVEKWSAQGSYVICDESFIDFLPQPQAYSALPLVLAGEHVIIVRSATKMFAIPGLRFGFAIGAPLLFAEISSNRDPWSVNHLAQVAAMAAYQDVEFELATARWLEQEQDYIRSVWGQQEDFHLFPFSANFFLVRASSAALAQRVEKELRKEGVFVRNCEQFSGLGADYLRVAVRHHWENIRLWTMVRDLAIASR